MSNSPGAGIVALLIVALLAIVMRWVFGSSRPRIRPPVDATNAELGLLHVAATGLSRADAVRMQARLRGHDIRSSVSRRADGHVDLLVFAVDIDRAKIVLGP